MLIPPARASAILESPHRHALLHLQPPGLRAALLAAGFCESRRLRGGEKGLGTSQAHPHDPHDPSRGWSPGRLPRGPRRLPCVPRTRTSAVSREDRARRASAPSRRRRTAAAAASPRSRRRASRSSTSAGRRKSTPGARLQVSGRTTEAAGGGERARYGQLETSEHRRSESFLELPGTCSSHKCFSRA